jgi:hypothetical protein
MHFAFAVLICLTHPVAGEASAPVLAELLAGRAVTVSSSQGDVLLNFAPDWTVRGRLLQPPLFASPQDEGRWRVASGVLCVRWREWLDGEEHCYRVSLGANGELSWRDDKGRAGRAQLTGGGS